MATLFGGHVSIWKTHALAEQLDRVGSFDAA
jgi:hypothetical protein